MQVTIQRNSDASYGSIHTNIEKIIKMSSWCVPLAVTQAHPITPSTYTLRLYIKFHIVWYDAGHIVFQVVGLDGSESDVCM